MPLETATYISALNSANPASGDGLSQADDHMRLIKSVILATFPNITGAVTGTHTALNALTAATYPFVTASLADNAVTTAKITDANVTAAKLASDSVTTVKILDANVTTAKLADLNVTTGKLNDLAVTAGKIAADAVTTVKILDANVTTAKLNDGAVTNAKITDATITDAKLATPGAVKKLAAATASTSAALSFTSGIDSTYRSYRFEIDSLLPATNNVDLIMEVSTDGGSSWKTTTYLSSCSGYSSAGSSNGAFITTAILLTCSTVLGNSAGGGWTGCIDFSNPSGASSRKVATFYGSFFTAALAATTSSNGQGSWSGGNDAITAVRFRASSGNLASGTVTMYGIKG